MEDTDPTPVEVPPFYSRPPTLKEDLQRYVRYEVNRAATNSGFESFEEADDFGIDDDDDLEDWDSEYQLTQMQEENTMSYMEDDMVRGEEDEADIGRQSEGVDPRRGDDGERGNERPSGAAGSMAQGRNEPGGTSGYSEAVQSSPRGVSGAERRGGEST